MSGDGSCETNCGRGFQVKSLETFKSINRGGGEQAEEAGLRGHLSASVEALSAIKLLTHQL
jgi:hypothetical protein